MRTIVALLVLMIATPAFAWDQEGFKRDIVWVTAMNAADYASTRFALSACPTCYEANSRMTEHMAAKKALGTAVVLGAFYLLRHNGHDRTARWLRWGIVALLMTVSAWNVSQGLTSNVSLRH